MYLLDTNVVSEMRKVSAGKADAGVAERGDPARGAILRRWLSEGVGEALQHRVLPVDETVARRAAAWHVPDPAPFRDALIGATALVHGLVMATRNERDFARFAGLRVVNPGAER